MILIKILKENYKQFLLFLFSVFIFLLPAIYNGFAIQNYDSGSYINNGFSTIFPLDRPITYSWLIKYCSLHKNCNFVLIIQSCFLSFTLLQFIYLYFSKINNISIVIILLVMTFFTSLSWYCSMLTPDIFTPIILLSIFNIIKSKSKFATFIFIIILIISITMHNINTVLSIITVLFISFFWLFKHQFKSHIQHLIILICAVFFSMFLLCFINYKNNLGLVLNKSTHIFLMGKLVDNGILKKYLDENCEAKSYAMYAYKDSLPNNFDRFIWDGAGVFVKTGGWKNSEVEYKKIEKDILLNQQYLSLYFQSTFKDAFLNITKFNICDDVAPYLEGSNPYNSIAQDFPWQLNKYINCRQQQNRLHLPFIRKIHNIFYIIFLVLFAWLLFKKININSFVLASIISFIIFQAFIAASFTIVFSRFSARVIWVLPLFILLTLFNFFSPLKSSSKL